MNEQDDVRTAQEALLSAVHRLAWPGTGELACEEPGHPAGHLCLAVPSHLSDPLNPPRPSGPSDSSAPSAPSPSSAPSAPSVPSAPSDRTGLSALQEALSGRYGQPRNLAMDGYADPTVTLRTGLSLLAPFGERLVEMRAWSHGSRWIGCGAARFDDGIRPVVLVAEGQDPAEDVPEGYSWVDGVVAVTGWDASGTGTVDWAETEARIGTPLPSDYKRLVDIFGDGAFDEYLHIHVPGACFKHADIVRQTEWLSEWASATRSGLWEPYELYPTPGGLLQWASTEQADGFFWLTEGNDPDRWPILITEDIPDSWVRFDGTTTEFIYRMLTDRQHPFSTARYFDTHWFESYARENEDQDEGQDRYEGQD